MLALIVAPGTIRETTAAFARLAAKRLWARLKQLSMIALSREELLMKLRAAQPMPQPRGAWSSSRLAPEAVTFTEHLDRNRLRNPALKQTLLDYNRQDCEVLE